MAYADDAGARAAAPDARAGGAAEVARIANNPRADVVLERIGEATRAKSVTV